MYISDSFFSMHNENLDNQHRHLYDLSKKITLMNKRHISPKELKELLKELLHLMNRHFMDEEAFMKEIAYPYLNHHMRVHRKIILEIEEIIIQEARYINALTERLDHVIQDLVFKHTKTEDKKVAQFYEEKFCNKN